MGLLPGLEPILRMRLLSGERAAAAMGCEVAVRLAKGFSSLAWVDIISTSIKICPIKSLKSENTVNKKRINISPLTSSTQESGVNISREKRTETDFCELSAGFGKNNPVTHL